MTNDEKMDLMFKFLFILLSRHTDVVITKDVLSRQIPHNWKTMFRIETGLDYTKMFLETGELKSDLIIPAKRRNLILNN